MRKPIFRINKTRQDSLVAELAAEISKPESFTRELPPEKMREAFTRLSFGGLQDYQEQLAKTEAPAEDYLDPVEMWQRSRHLGDCAWDHFRHHAQTRFHLALIELMHESLGFADAIYAERCGAGSDEIAAARPIREEIEHNVLRHTVTRLNQLPIQRPDNFWHKAEADDDTLSIQTQLARLIYKDLALWTYDHKAVTQALQKWILELVQKHENPQGEAKFWGRETAELIWEHIDGAIQVTLLILVNWALLLSKHSAVRRYEVEADPKEAKQIQPSKEQLKGIADTLITSWIDGLPFDWRGSGRPVKKSRDIESDRERLSQELYEIAATVSADGERITWDTLAMRRKRPPSNPQSGDSLRKEAAALGLHLPDFKPEKN